MMTLVQQFLSSLHPSYGPRLELSNTQTGTHKLQCANLSSTVSTIDLCTPLHAACENQALNMI